MTREEFLAKLRDTPRDWKITYRMIRRSEDTQTQCPISSLLNRNCSNPWKCALEIGIDRTLADVIADSADGYGNHKDPILRAQLLEACGLAENSQ